MKKRFHFYIIGGVLLIGLILGSFFDLQINAALFNKTNVFGLIVSSFGMIPGYGCLSLLGGALFYITLKSTDFKKWLKAILFVMSAAMFGISIYFLGKDVFSVNGFENKKLYWLGFVIMGVIMCGVFYLGTLLGKKNENPKMWIIILVLAAAIFMALVPGVTLFKSIMHRPRYRVAIYEGYSSFHNWWEPCKDYKDVINAYPSVLTKEEFKSFPSGHAGASMVGLISLSYLPLFNKNWMKHQTLLFYIAFGWGLVVMFARMLVGAHFLSDVCVGALLTVVFFYIANEIVVRKLLPEEPTLENE
jgi:membrane-associated phospholipid phosphatase